MKVLHMFLALFGKNQIFDYMTLKMTLNHQNNIRNGFSSRTYTKKSYYTCSYFYVLKILFLFQMGLF